MLAGEIRSWTPTASPPRPEVEAHPSGTWLSTSARASCPPHSLWEIDGELVTIVRELRGFLFGSTWHPSLAGDRGDDWERVRTL